MIYFKMEKIGNSTHNKEGSIISVVGKTTVGIMEPILL